MSSLRITRQQQSSKRLRHSTFSCKAHFQEHFLCNAMQPGSRRLPVPQIIQSELNFHAVTQPSALSCCGKIQTHRLVGGSWLNSSMKHFLLIRAIWADRNCSNKLPEMWMQKDLGSEDSWTLTPGGMWVFNGMAYSAPMPTQDLATYLGRSST